MNTIDQTDKPDRWSGSDVAIASWAVLGFAALLTRAIIGLTPLAIDGLHHPGELSWPHWLFLAVWIPWMAWAEGYKGFTLRLAPRLVGRAWHLARHRRILHIVLAPFFAVGYFHADKRTLISRYVLTTAIVGMIIGVRFLAQPWRGLVDAGVLLGLAWGVVSILVLYVRSLRGPDWAPAPMGLPRTERATK